MLVSIVREPGLLEWTTRQFLQRGYICRRVLDALQYAPQRCAMSQARADTRLKIRPNVPHATINIHSNGTCPEVCSSGPKKANPAISTAPDRHTRMVVIPPGTA